MLLQLIKEIFKKSEEIKELIPHREPIDWKSIASKIVGHLDNHTIYLELPESGWCKPQESSNATIATGIAVAYVIEGVEAWDTKAPTLHMVEKLSGILGKELPVMLNRDYRHFVGYYVYINT